MRPWHDADTELGASERARLGLALDQFRRALPRRQSLSVVHGDHGLMLVAIDAHVQRGGGLDELAKKAQEALDQAFADAPIRIALGYSGPHEHLRDAHRAHEHARLALRVAGAPARARHARRLGGASAPTACWPAPPRPRTPAS